MKFNENKVRNSQQNKESLRADLAIGLLPKLKEPRLIDDWVLWLEQRPKEGGRTTALIKPWGLSHQESQELTPAPFDLRSRLHGYGGAPLAVANKGDELFMAWINENDGSLWFQKWKGLKKCLIDKKYQLHQSERPICLSLKGKYFLGDGLIDLERNNWIGVMEKDCIDYLVAFSLNKSLQAPKIIYQPEDFLGYPTLSPTSNQLAWVEWKKPYMPWDKNDLLLGYLNEEGEISSEIKILVTSENSSEAISSFQPVWMEEGSLLFAEDSSGFWNLSIFKFGLSKILENNFISLAKLDEEFALPQWISGMSTIASYEDKIIGLSCDQGNWNINIITQDGNVNKVRQPFHNLNYLDVKKGRAISIASNSFLEAGLLEVDLVDLTWQHYLARQPVLDSLQISVGEPYWFKGFNNQNTHAWYYPPINQKEALPPLLLKIHSGPTAMSNRGLDLGIQFWTSRGWAVVDVNYGGSTGFGKYYRNRLKNSWGKVDVFDCIAVAKALIADEKANPNLIAIEGSSAGGFTALSCLCSSDIFKIAALKYPVVDLNDMVKSTHRFEKYYLDYLVGDLEKNSHIYAERSPINKLDNINSPIIFFHGLKDKVIPLASTKNIVNKLKEKGLPVELYAFPNEGHGFRDRQAQVKVFQIIEEFFINNLEF